MPSKPIKILHVVFSLEPGGMENGVVNVAKALRPDDFDIHVCCLNKTGAFAERMPDPSKIFALGRNTGFSLSATLALAKAIIRLKPDVVHSHNLGPLIYSGLATGLGRLAPLLQGEHSLLTDEECQPRRLKQRRQFYRFCRKVHTVSEGLRQQLVSLGLPEEKIVTVMNGVDSARFCPGSRQDARRQLGLPENGLMLGVVGRFGPFKRHAVLIGAFNRLASEIPDLRLLVVGGGGPEKDRVQALVEASPHAHRIHLVGFQNNLPPYYRAMDLLVVPSVNEGLSNAVLEAMSCGTPVLANNTCGNGEVISSGGDGVIAGMEAEAQLVGNLQKVLVEKHKLATMGEMARKNVMARFSLDAMVENYARLYREVAGRPQTK